MEDYLVRAVTRKGHVRGLACVTTRLVNEVSWKQGTSPTATAALGRALTGGALMGALLKTGQRVGLRFEGNGPLRKILVEADSDGTVRGTVGDHDADLPPRNGKLDVAGVLGRAGFLTVTKDLRLKDPYSGTVQLYTSEIAEDLAFYLTESEQIPSAVGLGVYVETNGGVSAAGGFLIQSLPPSDDAVINRLTEQIQAMPPITELLRRGRTPEELLDHIFSEIPIDFFEKRLLSFKCSCSKERVINALVSLGQKELNSMIEQEEAVEVTCEFCREVYAFSREEMSGLVKGIN
jgi:molecular chaperone Hsp33